MNRHQRRAQSSRGPLGAKPGQRFSAKCNMCDADACEVHVLKRRAVYADDPTAPEDLGICKGCPCSPGMCDSCGEVEGHWLGCKAVGLPSGPTKGKA